MPHRALLSSEQRIRLFAIPVDPAEMARHYVLGTQDQALVRAKRRASNRLGFAIQLCVLRYPGRVIDPAESPPASMLSFVASQIGIDPLLYGDYARRAETCREHLLELQKLLRLRSFSLPDWRACLQVGADAAWATDRGEPIVQAMLAHLRTTNVLLPAAAVLERIGLAARVRARRKVFEALADGLTDAERDALESLLTVDPEMRRSRFAWLRDGCRGANSIASLRSNSIARMARNLHEGSDQIFPPASAIGREGRSRLFSTLPISNPRGEPPSSWPKSPAWGSNSRTRPSPCSRSTWARCSPRPRTGTNGGSRPQSATSPRRCCCSAAPLRR